MNKEEKSFIHLRVKRLASKYLMGQKQTNYKLLRDVMTMKIQQNLVVDVNLGVTIALVILFKKTEN